jgi:hypothetical protein
MRQLDSEATNSSSGSALFESNSIGSPTWILGAVPTHRTMLSRKPASDRPVGGLETMQP